MLGAEWWTFLISSELNGYVVVMASKMDIPGNYNIYDSPYSAPLLRVGDNLGVYRWLFLVQKREIQIVVELKLLVVKTEELQAFPAC